MNSSPSQEVSSAPEQHIMTGDRIAIHLMIFPSSFTSTVAGSNLAGTPCMIARHG
ncbi:hypothetical protein BJX64DRAFT_259713 [Aspergillus heterothallicus]